MSQIVCPRCPEKEFILRGNKQELLPEHTSSAPVFSLECRTCGLEMVFIACACIDCQKEHP
jgi:hypothetical protein